LERRADHRGVLGGIRGVLRDTPGESFVDHLEVLHMVEAGVLRDLEREQPATLDQILDGTKDVAASLGELVAVQTECLDRRLATRVVADRADVFLVKLKGCRRVFQGRMDEQRLFATSSWWDFARLVTSASGKWLRLKRWLQSWQQNRRFDQS
jgi:hypothetical protein